MLLNTLYATGYTLVSRYASQFTLSPAEWAQNSTWEILAYSNKDSSDNKNT